MMDELQEDELSRLSTATGLELLEHAKAGNLEECRRLLDSGAPVKFRDEESGWTALMWAACQGHLDVVELLIEHKAADIDENPQGDNKIGTTPLHWAAYKGHTQVVWALLCAGMSSSALDSEKNTALHLAASGGHTLILKTLLSQGVTVGAKNMYDNTALQLATSHESRQLLLAAATAANLGLFFYCSCSGEFVTEADSVAMLVIDRVSAPCIRPVRYTRECAQRIQNAQEALQAAMKTADTEIFQAALTEAEGVGVNAPVLDAASSALLRLKAQIDLQAQVWQIGKLRPLTERAQIRPMVAPLKTAREREVQPELLEAAERLVRAVDAEISLQEVTASCQCLTVPEEDGPSALTNAGLAARVESGISKLASAIALAQSAEATEEVIAAAEQLHRRLGGEADLRHALEEPRQSTNEEGLTQYTHPCGSVTNSVLEALTLRNDQLDAAVDKCLAEGVVESVLVEAQKEQKTLKANLKQAVAEDEERKTKEAAAAAKAAKKKKGAKKKK